MRSILCYCLFYGLMVVLCTCRLPLFGQVIGGNPPKTRWESISLPGANVIYDAGNDSTAQIVADIISKIPPEGRKRKVDVVLQSSTLRANGYVGLAPFRSEFYLTPPADAFSIGPGDWPKLLAVHEYRHVQQYRKMNRGLSRAAQVIFGEGGRALANAAAVPNWFFEGDAVDAETRFSYAGRGHLPAFFEGFKALWDYNIHYSYEKLRNGSYKDFVPGHYPLGYMLVSHGREKFGDSFWDSVSVDAAAYKYGLYPFQSSFARHAKMPFKDFRQQALASFKEKFARPKAVSERQKVVDELFPVAVHDTVFYVRKSSDKIAAFYLRTGGKDVKIADKGISLDDYFNYRDGSIVYSAYRPNSRWGNIEYGEILVLDVRTGKQHRITQKTRYLSPDIRNKEIVAVHYDDQNRTHLHLIHAETGRVIKAFPNSRNLVFTHPVFADDSTVIAAVRDARGYSSVIKLNLVTGTFTNLLPFSTRAIDYPYLKNDTLYFTASGDVEEKLMAATGAGDVSTLEMNVRPHPFSGFYRVTAGDSGLYWHGFTPYGNKIVGAAPNHLTFSLVPDFEKPVPAADAPLSGTGRERHYHRKHYKQSTRLFNFHSVVPEISETDYSLALIGENVLNNFSSALTLTYNTTEQYKRASFSGTYSGLFPYITGGVRYTRDRRTYYKSNFVRFNQLEPFAGLSLPLALHSGKTYRFFNAASFFTYNHTTFSGIYKDTFPSINYSYLNNSISFSNQTQRAKQNIYPRFAQSLNVNYKTALSNRTGNQLTLQGNLYLPGLFPNNSLQLSLAHQRKDSLGQISFSSSFPFSRGYHAANFYRMWKGGATYYFPVAYPDAGFANIFYLLRIRAGVFYDHTTAVDFTAEQKIHRMFRSTGTEWMFDVKWWNQIEVAFGVRYSYLFDRDLQAGTRSQWEIILPVNLFR